MSRKMKWVLFFSMTVVVLGGGGYLVGERLWFRHHLERAKKELADHNFKEARSHLDRCRRVSKKNPEVLLLSARAARRDKDFNEAKRFLTLCREREGDTEATQLESALLRVEMGNVGMEEVGLLRKLEENHPDSPAILEAMIDGYFRTHRYAQAADFCGRWLEKNPNDVYILIRRGKCLEKLNQKDECETVFARVVELDPDNLEARLLLAEAYARTKQPEEALPHFQYVVKREPENFNAFLGLAISKGEIGETEEAVEILDGLLQKRPEHVRAMIERGRFLFVLRKYQEAETSLKKAVEREPFHADAYYLLARVLYAREKSDEAKQADTEHQQVGTELQTLRELSVKITEDPNNPDLRYQIAQIYLKRGPKIEGVRWLMSALSENPNHAPSHQALATYYESIGDKEKAARHRLPGNR